MLGANFVWGVESVAIQLGEEFHFLRIATISFGIPLPFSCVFRALFQGCGNVLR